MRTRALAILTAFAVVTLLAGTIRAQSPPTQPVPPKSAVAIENQNPGTTSWKSPELNQGRRTPLTASEAVGRAGPVWTDQVIRGYASATSVSHGQPITLYVSTAAPTFSLDVYRMGYYGGAGARLMLTKTRVAGQNQPVPTPDPTTGLIEAGWAPSYTLQTGADWVSGAYLVKLTASTGQVGYITFVVRNDVSNSDIIYQVAVNTYQAYNNWGGKSLYDFNSLNSVQAVKVSFDRPYTAWSGAGSLFDGDFSMIRFLEREGYDVTYTTSVDLHESNVPVTGHKVFLSNFHDEYWSTAMRDRLTAARNAGMDLAFFDANTMYWQVRLEPSTKGTADRVIVGYKETAAADDPMRLKQPAVVTGLWREAPVNRPENELIGVMFESFFDFTVSFPWVVQNADHWVYAGTGVTNGTQIPGLVGYEYDKVWNNGSTPAGLVSLSNSPVVDHAGVAGIQNAGIYTAASGAIVFNAGTIIWPWKLDDSDYQQHGADPRVQQMTRNVLNTMITGRQPSASPSPSPTPNPLGLTIFDDALAPGWENFSRSATVDFAATAQVYDGTKSLSFSTTAPFGALSLQTSTPFSGSQYAYLRFAARATTPGQRYTVRLYGPGVVPIGNAVVLANYGGDPIPGDWKLYSIPLDADNLNVAALQVSGVEIQDFAGVVQPPLYLDDLGFAAGPAPTPTASPSPTPTASPCPKPGTCGTPPLPTSAPGMTPSPAPTPSPGVTPTPTPTPAPTTGPCPKPGACSVAATPSPVPMPAPTKAPTPVPVPKPMAVSGTARLNGTPPTKGTVEALVNGTVCGSAAIGAGGSFQLSVASASQTPGCATGGAVINFRVNGQMAAQTVTFTSGGTANLALSSP